jgi:WD40 repeat protein
MTIRLWDVATGKELGQFPGFHGAISSVAFSPDGSMLASASEDHRIRLWSIGTQTLLRQLTGHQGSVKCVVFSPCSGVLASGAEDQTLRLWDAAKGEEVAKYRVPKGGITSLAISADGEQLLSGGTDQVIRLWKTSNGQPLLQLPQHDRVECVAFSPNGKMIAAGNWDRIVRAWDVATGKMVRRFSGHSGGVKSIAFSPDGSLLASGSGDMTVRLWDMASGRFLRRLWGHEGVVLSVAFSPVGNLFASESSDNTIWLWDATTWRELRQLHGHLGLVSTIAFSPNGKMLASASTAGSLEVRNVFRHDRDLSLTAADLVPADLEQVWADLADPSTRKALHAIRALVTAGAQAVAFLKGKLQPAVPLDPAALKSLVEELLGADPALAPQAGEKILQLGEQAEPHLRDALAAGTAAANRPRIEGLLEQIQDTAAAPENLRVMRALQGLSRIPTAEARELLRTLAGGAPSALLTQEAQAALQRLSAAG